MISVKVKGEQSPAEMERAMRDLVRMAKDNRRAFRKMAKQVLIPSAKRAFASQTAQDGERWEKVTPDYAEAKKAAGKGRKLLQRSGALKKSMTRVGKGVAGLRIYGKKYMKIGTTLNYAVPLQWGYGAKSFSTSRAKARGSRRRTASKGLRSDVPSRRFVSWSRPMREEAARLMVDHMQIEADLAAAKLAKKGGR